MSTDPAVLAQQRRKGLRVALAVSAGFTFAVWSGAVIPFLGPLFAAQFLLAGNHPMSFGKTLGATLVILVTGILMLVLTGLFADRPASLIVFLGLTYFMCFAAQTTGRGGPAIVLVLIVAIIVPLLGILNKDLAGSILSILVTAVLSGTLLMWMAHVIFPEPPLQPLELESVVRRAPDVYRALASSCILLASVVICLTSDNLTAAAVIPITVASVLGQFDSEASIRASVGLALVNVLGGLVASAAYMMLTLRPNLLSIFLIVLVVALLLGGRASIESKGAPMFAGALSIFLILFGLGVSPLPGSAAETFATRIIYVASALAYTLLFAALLLAPRRVRSSAAGVAAEDPM